MRTILTSSLAAMFLAVHPAAAKPKKCVVHGREISNLESVTCSRAQEIATYFFTYAKAPNAWTCQGEKGQVWKGYCESDTGVRYFSWKPLG